MQPFSLTLQCIPWLVVLIIECLAIVILNIITILVFVKKKRQLQRQSTYLIIHLTIVDLLVGAVCGPLQIEIKMEWYCSLWNYRRKTIWSNLSLFFICVSYILIVIKVRCSRHPQIHSRSRRESKLTGTALIVSLASLLCLLPGTIMFVTCIHLSSACFKMHHVHINMAVVVLFLANSLVNPIIYALRMPGFREGLSQLVCKVPDLSRIAPANLPLRNLRRA
ncbi:unnamed protein product [Pocillopora meandrina]|uniref:G-protein coupled receptors family 1 profile domain-containing protein n=1 Tax=Pocillopora meandrina TaxID=46732 RepID=A0AAU9WW17_9CNID|nr:unnamed protein product [Pocillopora meandrina]